MISVLLCIYKESLECVEKSIDSILSQTYKNFELIIVVDNPFNIEVIDYLKKKSSNDLRMKCFINEKNIGLASSLNVAISKSKGEYIARMDADDISLSDRFEKSVEYLEKNGLDLIGAIYQNIDMNGNILANSCSSHYSLEQTKRILRFTNIVPHPTWFGKREIFIELGGYRLIQYAEDYDFLLRALNKKYKISVADFKALFYRVNTDGISQSNFFKQFLLSEYLSKKMDILDSLSPDYINDIALAKYSKRKDNNFCKSNYYFTKAKKSRFLIAMFYYLLAFVESKYYRKKMLLMLRKKIVILFN